METSLLETIIVAHILSPQYIKDNIHGAPFEIGDAIKVNEQNICDSTFENKFIGLEGIIIFFEYNCGCCQSYPNDPMIGVQFPNGEIFEFWKEEITKL
jgi:hypothetical protein